MDKDRSKKKGDTLWKQVKSSAAQLFEPNKPKNQGKESCKNSNILTLFHVSCGYFWRLRTILFQVIHTYEGLSEGLWNSEVECFFPLRGADLLPSYSVAQLGNWSVELEVVQL